MAKPACGMMAVNLIAHVVKRTARKGQEEFYPLILIPVPSCQAAHFAAVVRKLGSIPDCLEVVIQRGKGYGNPEGYDTIVLHLGYHNELGMESQGTLFVSSQETDELLELMTKARLFTLTFGAIFRIQGASGIVIPDEHVVGNLISIVEKKDVE